MAKTSSVEKNNKKRALADKYWKYRAELRAKVIDVKLSDEERHEAHIKLQKLPRNTSPHRVVNRCNITGRPRGYFRKFGMSRIALREYASLGLIPGVTKASW